MEPAVYPIPNPAPFPNRYAPYTPPQSETSFSAILQNLPEVFASHAKEVSHLALKVIIDHVLPAILFAAAFIGLWNLGRIISRVVWPPSGRETYLEALALLKKDAFVESDGGGVTSSSTARSEALDLLRTAIAKDAELEEAYVVLATELLYGGGGGGNPHASSIDIEQALGVLQTAKKGFPKNDEVDKLLTEAMAMKKFGVRGTEAANGKMRKMAAVGMFGSDSLGGGSRVR